ncbi:MAG: fluoride efflux transporter CrcB [Pseudomonadales bacterium]|nr:fluoride efflux transporter CrcB [Pseudomonadales bacterium]
MNIPLIHLVWVAIGGGLGAMSRFAVSSWLSQTGSGFPWGTYVVNVLGSLLAGAFLIFILSDHANREVLRLLLLVGFFGAFTTFSTFSFETVRLIESGQISLALANVLGNLLSCLLGAWLGMTLAKLF